MQKSITVAIDGYSSTGKSTLAKQLARHFGFVYVDSGAMYRAVTWFALQHKYIDDYGTIDVDALLACLTDLNLKFWATADEGSHIMLNGYDVESDIRSMEVSKYVSQIAELAGVRAFLTAMQRGMANNQSIVMDGRDVGTTVFPNAEVKLFITADRVVRAQRRYDELQQNGIPATLSQILENIDMRDYTDVHRKVSPLVKAEDAFLIDNTQISRQQQLELAIKIVEQALNA